jgi:DNA-binding NarL/FixJ family response regulator
MHSPSDRPEEMPSGSRSSFPPWVNRVYIVDDHPFFTFALTSLVNGEADLAVCGSSHKEATVLDDVARLSPDIVVIDVNLSSHDGFGLAAALRSFAKHVPILFLSSLQNPRTEIDSRPLEPCSFVEKNKDPADIIQGIRQTLAKFRILQGQQISSNLTPKT